jgi:hypothetical protein
MGNKKETLGKAPKKLGSSSIPPDSPLDLILLYWVENSRTKGKVKQKMIKYCSFIWTQDPILRLSVFWLIFGASKD